LKAVSAKGGSRAISPELALYLSSVLDDFSRYIVAWKLCTTMVAADVTTTLDSALQACGLDQAPLNQPPRLLRDSGPSYVAAELADWLDEQGMGHTRGKPYHPMRAAELRCRWICLTQR